VDDPAEHVPEVAVRAQEVLRLGQGATEGMDARGRPPLHPGLDPEQAGGRAERRDDVGHEGGQHEQREDDQAEHRAALAQDVAERVAPQRCRSLAGEGIGETLRDRLGEAGHQVSRTRGSSFAYDRSTSRFTTMNRTATRTAKPWMIW
jgi:hypothetical protein